MNRERDGGRGVVGVVPEGVGGVVRIVGAGDVTGLVDPDALIVLAEVDGGTWFELMRVRVLRVGIGVGESGGAVKSTLDRAARGCGCGMGVGVWKTPSKTDHRRLRLVFVSRVLPPCLMGIDSELRGLGNSSSPVTNG